VLFGVAGVAFGGFGTLIRQSRKTTPMPMTVLHSASGNRLAYLRIRPETGAFKRLPGPYSTS